MNTWLPVVILIVVVLAAGLLREHRRVSGIERWGRSAAPLHPRGARVWGVGLEGMVDASPCTIAEYAASKPGTRSGDEWFTLVYWPSPRADEAGASLRRGASAWPHDGTLLREGRHAGWRLPGTITSARLDHIVRLLPEARQHLA